MAATRPGARAGRARVPLIRPVPEAGAPRVGTTDNGRAVLLRSLYADGEPPLARGRRCSRSPPGGWARCARVQLVDWQASQRHVPFSRVHGWPLRFMAGMLPAP